MRELMRNLRHSTRHEAVINIIYICSLRRVGRKSHSEYAAGCIAIASLCICKGRASSESAAYLFQVEQENKQVHIEAKLTVKTIQGFLQGRYGRALH